MVEALKTVGVVVAACLVGVAAAGVVYEYLDYAHEIEAENLRRDAALLAVAFGNAGPDSVLDLAERADDAALQ